MERRIPITRKQHQMFANTYAQLNEAQKQITIAASAIMAGEEEDIAQAQVVGVDDSNGVFALVLQLPDPPEPPK